MPTHVLREIKGDVAIDGKGIQSAVPRLELGPSSCPVTLGKSLKHSLPLFPHLQSESDDNNTYFTKLL